jgi:hypothetical protein
MHCPYCSIEYSAVQPCFCHPPDVLVTNEAQPVARRFQAFPPMEIEIPASSELLIATADVSAELNCGLA